MADSKLTICTCSMLADLELFKTLAASIDLHVDAGIRHLVVVPKAHLEAFAPFASDRRDIIAQEDVLPFRMYQLPKTTQRLTFVSDAFRRPIYLDRKLRRVRGWMLQQILKIEISRLADETAIMHVDSDVCFVRSFDASDAFIDGKPILFYVDKPADAETGRDWSKVAARLLGLDDRNIRPRIFVENCIIWSSDVVRAMVARIEATTSGAFSDVLIELPTLSEYVVYGVFASETDIGSKVAHRPVPPCYSLWNGKDFSQGGLEDVVASMRPEHAAVALQSTDSSSSQDRSDFFDRIRKRLAETSGESRPDAR